MLLSSKFLLMKCIILFSLQTVALWAGGRNHASAVTEEGELLSWWYGASTYVLKEEFESPVIEVDCGEVHSVALLSNKTVRAFPSFSKL